MNCMDWRGFSLLGKYCKPVVSLLGALFAGAYFLLAPVNLAPYLLYVGCPVSQYELPASLLSDLKPVPVAIPVCGAKQFCRGFYFRGKSRTTVLISHGQGNLIPHLGMVRAAHSAGYSCLIYDYRGFGLSDGRASTAHMLEDGVAAYDYLEKQLGLSPKEIILMGTSLGTGVSAHVARLRPCRALLLVSPYTTLRRAVCDRLPFFSIYPDFQYSTLNFWPKPSLECLSIEQARVPVTLVHGGKDSIIAVSNARELRQRLKSGGRLVIQEGVEHGGVSVNLVADELKAFSQASKFGI